MARRLPAYVMPVRLRMAVGSEFHTTYGVEGGGTDVPDRGVFPTGVGGVCQGAKSTPLVARRVRRSPRRTTVAMLDV